MLATLNDVAAFVAEGEEHRRVLATPGLGIADALAVWEAERARTHTLRATLLNLLPLTVGRADPDP